MLTQPRSILRSNTQSTTNTTKRVTWADEPIQLPRRPPPSIIPPSRVRTRVAGMSVRQKTRSRDHVKPHREQACRKQRHEKEARRRRKADGVVKKRTGIDVRRPEVNKKNKKNKKKPVIQVAAAATTGSSEGSKKKKKCKRGLSYARQYVIDKCQLKDDDILDMVDARTMYKIYVDVRRRLGKKVDDGLRRRMVEDESKIIQVKEDRRVVRRKRRHLESFVNKMLPSVKAEAFGTSQLSRAAFAAVMARFDQVQRERTSN